MFLILKISTIKLMQGNEDDIFGYYDGFIQLSMAQMAAEFLNYNEPKEHDFP